MVTPHQRILAAVGDGARVVLDTPYGFQENADELSARTVEYFARNVGHDVGVVSLRDAATTGAVALEVAAARVALALIRRRGRGGEREHRDGGNEERDE